MLERLIEARGFRLDVLRYDMQAAVNRIAVTGNVHELDELNRDQLLLMMIASDDKPGSPRWNYFEMRYGPIETGAPRTTN